MTSQCRHDKKNQSIGLPLLYLANWLAGPTKTKYFLYINELSRYKINKIDTSTSTTTGSNKTVGGGLMQSNKIDKIKCNKIKYSKIIYSCIYS